MTQHPVLDERSPAPVAREKSSFRPDIQGLRAVAVILVILYHAGVPGFEGGYVGVDVFFVISGFVITGLLLRQPHRSIRASLSYFYQRRVRRIMPAATIVLIVTVLAAKAMLGTYFDPTLLVDVRWASLFAANLRFIETGGNYFVQGVQPSLITHFWSLGVEEQFYLCYPLIVFSVAAVIAVRWRRAALATILVAVVLLSSWWSHHLTAVNPVAAYYEPFTRAWELALGALMALAVQRWPRRRTQWNQVIALVALVVIVVVSMRLSAQSGYPGLLAWWPCGATAVLLWTGRTGASVGPAKWLSERPMRYIGDLSYSLYLWHYPWLAIPASMVHPWNSPADRLVEVLGAFACAVVSYHLIENPIRHSKRLNGDGWAVFAIAAICVVAVFDASFLAGR